MKPFIDSSFPFTGRAAMATAVALLIGASSAIAQTSSSTGTSSTNQNRGSSSTYGSSSSNQGSMSGSASGTSDSTYGRSNRETTSTTSGAGSTYGSMGSDNKLERADRRFITKAADSGQAEVQLAQLAAQRASNPEVRSFAQQLLRDHQQVNSELMKIAGNKNVKLDDDDGKGLTYRRLSRKSGADFDEEFIETMIDDHEKDVKLFEKASTDARDQEVRSFASKHVGHLRDHLSQAQNLRQTIVPTGRSDANANQSAAGSTTDSMGTSAPSSASGTTSSTDTSGSGTTSSQPSSSTSTSGGSDSSSTQRPNNSR